VRVSQADAVVNHLAELVTQESLEPGSVDTVGNRNPAGAPWGVYPCAGDDEWCVITVRDDGEWRALTKVVNDPVLQNGARFATPADRHAHQDDLDERLTEWTSSRAPRDVMDALQAAGVPAAVVLTPDGLLDDPHLAAHDFLQVVLQPGWDPLFVEGDCFRAAQLVPERAGPAPRQGQHTREIAAELLGLDDAEVERLVAGGVLEV
jgi:crotonobetainyl-CoA:carnitine CoA-transferase CaiB-like acyl-CoA transferase